MKYAGEWAALATALCWAFNSVCFTEAGKRVGSPTVNVTRLVMALVLLLGVHGALFGTAFPLHLGRERLGALALSGVIGFALGDALLFEAFLCLGARVAMLLMTLSPVFSALLARICLGQSLGAPKAAAILAVLAGIAWVVGDRMPERGSGSSRRWTLGLVLGVGGALGQSLGLILSNRGMAGGLHPLSATLVRVAAGTVAIGLWFLLRGTLGVHARALRDARATALIAAGAVTGPVVGVALSLYAITHTSMGVAATLMALSPVILLVIYACFFHEKISPRAWAGTILSLGGTAALFWL